MSKTHQEKIASETSKLSKLFLEACEKSLEETKKIETSNQTDFEDYLKEFLEKIS